MLGTVKTKGGQCIFFLYCPIIALKINILLGDEFWCVLDLSKHCLQNLSKLNLTFNHM